MQTVQQRCDAIEAMPSQDRLDASSQQFLAGETIPPQLERQLGRACTAHCLAVARDHLGVSPPASREDFIDFVAEYGAETESPFYSNQGGWNLIALADVLRLEGCSVVVQNMRYGSEATSIVQATQTGRVRSAAEQCYLTEHALYGGDSTDEWLDAVHVTLRDGGVSATSMNIPLLSGDGFGRHSVLVTEMSERAVTYFDPDYYNVVRLGSAGYQVHAVELGGRYYRQAKQHFTARMSGEVTHIVPSLDHQIQN